ncbi:MAG: M16 family metallopeptidase [Acidimicrobiales bacterium]
MGVADERARDLVLTPGATQPGMIKTTRLNDELMVVTESMEGAHSVCVGFWVDAGSRDESSEQAGASHFLEHLLFKGTGRRSARDIAEAVDAVGGDLNAFTTKEYTAFYARLLGDDLDLGLDILCDIVGDPALRPDDVESERQVILEEIAMTGDDPGGLATEMVETGMFGSHPLGREVAGEPATVSALSRDDLVGYLHAHYRPANMVVTAAGRVDHARLTDGIGNRLNGWLAEKPNAAVVNPGGGRLHSDRAGDSPVNGSPRGSPVGSHLGSRLPLTPDDVLRSMREQRPSEQAHLVVGLPALSRTSPSRHALAVLDQALGGSMSSRLFQEIRENRGLAYSVYSWHSAYAECGLLGIYAGCLPERAAEVLGLIGHELDRLAESGLSDRELAVAKGHLRGSLALSQEDSGTRMGRLGYGQLVHGRSFSFDESVAATEAVTGAQVTALAAELAAGPRVLSVVGPFDEKGTDALINALGNASPLGTGPLGTGPQSGSGA